MKMWRESASLILAAKSVFSQANKFNYKVLCLQRSSKSKFMPKTHVFPGGNISKTDSSVEWLEFYEKFGLNTRTFDILKPTENIPQVFENDEENRLPKYLSFRICAIRETFEECGILLCRYPKINHDTNSNWASFIGGHELMKWQHKVHDDSREFLNLCKQFEIYPDVWALKNWSNWITPTVLPSRFNTIFFLATLDQMPSVHPDQREIENLMWNSPDQYNVLNNQEETILFPPPQFYEIARLGTMTDLNKLSEYANERSKYGIETYLPFRISTDEGIYTILPGDDLYPNKIDENDKEIGYVPKLADSNTKHRILHKSAFSNEIIIENYTPKHKHILPHPTF